jgi:hypothetical protein
MCRDVPQGHVARTSAWCWRLEKPSMQCRRRLETVRRRLSISFRSYAQR